jgi:OmcA/MtrC family decaheme c-type cytochrome
MLATPNPVPVCDQTAKGSTTISWGTGLDPFEIHYTSPEGVTKLFHRRANGTAGSKVIDGWLRDGSKFTMMDMDGNTIQAVGVNTTVLGCAGNPPGAPVGVAGMQHTKWMTNPSRKTCGSCHDYIDWDTGQGHSANNWPQTSDNNCYLCHGPDSGGEYDPSVNATHQVWWKSAQLPGLLVELIDIVDTDPGDTPTVTFKIGDKFGPLNPSDVNRLRFRLNGPNTDFSFNEEESVDDKAVWKGDNVWAYTFETAIPMDAMGSYTVSVEGRNNADIDTGSEIISERDAIENPMLAFAVTDSSAKARRVIVDDAKCEACHGNVSLHGDNRKNAQYCVTCHNPTLLDIADVPESVNQKWMIHKIHRGADLENGYTVIRSRGTYVFDDVHYTGDLRNCEACHVNDSHLLPLPSGLIPQLTPNFWWDEIDPVASSCLSCHDGDDAVIHAYVNTSMVFGESCSTCHGQGRSASVEMLHAR